jgi:hypothetical protein
MSSEERRGGEFITRYEAEGMTTEALRRYEREVVEPRHVETQRDLGDIKKLVQQGSGMVKLGAILASAASILWIVLQIARAVTGHAITIGTN